MLNFINQHFTVILFGVPMAIWGIVLLFVRDESMIHPEDYIYRDEDGNDHELH